MLRTTIVTIVTKVGSGLLLPHAFRTTEAAPATPFTSATPTSTSASATATATSNSYLEGHGGLVRY